MILRWMNAEQTILFVDEIEGEPSLVLDPTSARWSEFAGSLSIETYAAPPVTSEDVNIERRRRLEAGVDITLADGVTVIPLQGRDEDMRNLHGLCTAAQLRIAAGDTTHETTFRDRDNNDNLLTPPQIVDLWSQGAAWVSAVYQASWAIKDAEPIPSDYTDDSRWP